MSSGTVFGADRVSAGLELRAPRHRDDLGGAIIGLLFEKQAKTIFRPPAPIAPTLAMLGIALCVFDRAMPMRRTIGEIALLDAA